MLTFKYQARDNNTNKVIKSTITAESEVAAGKILMDQGLIPMYVKEIEPNLVTDFLKGRISLKDRLVFTRQLSTLIGSGIPLTQSLHTVYEQTENKKLQSVVLEITTDVESGKTLAGAFEKHPKVFDKLYVSLITAGEASGTLDLSLQRIADQQEKDAQMMSKIKSAMTYPLIVLAVINIVLIFMMLMVVPQVEKLYADMNLTLPTVTLILVGVANFISKYWWLVIIIVAVGVYFLIKFLNTKKGSELMDSFKLNVPLFKEMFRKLYMARFMRTCALLLDTGVSMLDSLAISGESVNNSLVEKSIKNAAEKVKTGKTLSESIKKEDYILLLVPQMISIGEQSGKISQMMDKVAKIYEEELEEKIKSISTMIEPLLMVVMAVMAGIMVAAILLPIYGLVNKVNI